MNKKEVIKEIGGENWKMFETWMRGQTVGVSKDGKEDYYTHDVEKFMRRLKGSNESILD